MLDEEEDDYKHPLGLLGGGEERGHRSFIRFKLLDNGITSFAYTLHY